MHCCPENMKSKIRFREMRRIAVDVQVVLSNSYACDINQRTSLRDTGLVSCSA